MPANKRIPKRKAFYDPGDEPEKQVEVPYVCIKSQFNYFSVITLKYFLSKLPAELSSDEANVVVGFKCTIKMDKNYLTEWEVMQKGPQEVCNAAKTYLESRYQQLDSDEEVHVKQKSRESQSTKSQNDGKVININTDEESSDSDEASSSAAQKNNKEKTILELIGDERSKLDVDNKTLQQLLLDMISNQDKITKNLESMNNHFQQQQQQLEEIKNILDGLKKKNTSEDDVMSADEDLDGDTPKPKKLKKRRKEEENR